MPPTVVIDACVLYSAPLRDLLIRIAVQNVYLARWSEQILDEMERGVVNRRPDIDPERLKRTRRLMSRAVRNSVVVDHEHRIPALQLPDPEDRHVLAAAIHCEAKTILTYNLKDFPDSILEAFGIQAVHPDDFLNHLLTLNLPSVLDVVRELRSRLRNPPQSAEQLLATYLSLRLPKTVAILQRNLDSI